MTKYIRDTIPMITLPPHIDLRDPAQARRYQINYRWALVYLAMQKAIRR